MRWRRDSANYICQVLTRAAVLLVLVVLASLSSVANGQETPRPKRILALYWYGRDFPANIVFDEHFQAAFRSAPPGSIEYYPEYLETNRFPGENQSKLLVDYLRHKYADRQIDVIFALANPSYNFLLKYRHDLFPNTPIVFQMVKSPDLSNQVSGPGVTGVIFDNAYRNTLDVALKLHPGTEQVLLVSGTPERDKLFETEMRQDLKEFEGRVKLTYLTDLPLNELMTRVSNTPERSIVFYIRQSQDESGMTLSPRDVLVLIAQSSKVPVYGIVDTFVGNGITGGAVISTQASTGKVTEILLRIANGERPQDIPVAVVPTTLLFDSRELRRWGINENNLPVGSVVRFKEPTLWQLYKWRIIGTISLIVLQTLLIIYLLILRAKRDRAQAESTRFSALAEAEHRRLEEIVANVQGIVWESRIVPGSADRKTTFVSSYAEKMLGYSVDEWLATSGFGFSLMPEEDRERMRRESDAVMRSGTDGVSEFRWVTKDGRVLWVETYLAAICDETGASIGLRGVSVDITDRKHAEEDLWKRTEELKEAQRIATVGSWEWEPVTDTVIWSEELFRIYGRDPSLPAANYREHRDLYTPESWDRLRAAVEKCLETGKPYELELQAIRADGKVLWTSARGESLKDSSGRVRKLRGTLQDITERRQAEEELRLSEKRFSTLADTAPVMIWMSGPDKLCTYFNRGWLDFTGRTMEQELGNGWAKGVYSEDYAACLGVYESASDRREPFQMEYRLRRHDGVFRWIYDTGTPRFSAGGDFLGYLGTCIDIADRKEGEENLRIAHEEVSRLKNQLQAENIYLQEEIRLAHNVDEIVGQSDEIKYVLYKIEQVAQTDSTVIILGETGTGKELVARAIHSQSGRKARPLVKVNCAALSASLIESELFGHEKGSFTGATARKIGRFELANDATIFLDEIGELPLELQVKLLRVIQEGEVERLGSSKTIKVNARIIAATNRNLKDEVEQGTFREDLWYRLNVFPITVPPLRNRKSDIPDLVQHFTRKFAYKIGKNILSISPAALEALKDHTWPGNIRELANVIERAVINCEGSVLRLADQLEKRDDHDSSANITMEEIERQHIIRILDYTGWVIEGEKGAARILGLKPSTLRTRMAKLGIQRTDRGRAATTSAEN
jgi:formate hydrogenlyase transcriptional activator